jgi:hypothetical protein
VGAGCTPCPSSVSTSVSAVLLGLVFFALVVIQFWYILSSGDHLLRRVIREDRIERDFEGNFKGAAAIFGGEDVGADDSDEDEDEDEEGEGKEGGKKKKKDEKDGESDSEKDAADSDDEHDPDKVLAGRPKPKPKKAKSADGEGDESEKEEDSQTNIDKVKRPKTSSKNLDKRITLLGPAPPPPDFQYKLKVRCFRLLAL